MRSLIGSDGLIVRTRSDVVEDEPRSGSIESPSNGRARQQSTDIFHPAATMPLPLDDRLGEGATADFGPSTSSHRAAYDRLHCQNHRQVENLVLMVYRLPRRLAIEQPALKVLHLITVENAVASRPVLSTARYRVLDTRSSTLATATPPSDT